MGNIGFYLAVIIFKGTSYMVISCLPCNIYRAVAAQSDTGSSYWAVSCIRFTCRINDNCECLFYQSVKEKITNSYCWTFGENEKRNIECFLVCKRKQPEALFPFKPSARTEKGVNGMKTNYLKQYIISSYILVWMLIIFVAGTVSLVFHAPPVIMWVVRNLIAWSPTYLLLIGWKHFRPDETRTAFVKRCFSGKVKLLPLLLSFFLTFGISVLSLFLYSIIMGKPMLSYINPGTTALPLSISLSLTSGPTGEELGWRGFMREEFNKKHSFLKSSVCQGLVWCFWHTLLWVVDSEFTDWRAIPYVISNIVVITSITVLMNIFLEQHNNLLYSGLLHFGFNILYVFLDADIGFFVILTVLYLVITPVAVLVRNKTVERLLKKS